ncbi:MAG: prephenate dehydratase [Bacillota bacterium]|jgi:prephenate dehydratase
MEGKKTIGYLGPLGTFCEIAAETVYPNQHLCPYPNIISVIKAVAWGSLDGGILPMENLLEGTVIPVLDGLTNYPEVKISGELIIPIRHCLLAHPGKNINEITAVLSHSHALAQCREFLDKQFPSLPRHSVPSTAEAARRVALELNACAAIGNKRAAQIYRLHILAEDIGDTQQNFTRFIVISKEIPTPSKKNKTSIAISLEHKPGSLAGLLNLFAQAGINLTKIESRPSRKIMGEYIFYVDFEGHIYEEKIINILEKAEQYASHLTVMGSYGEIKSLG